MRKIKTVTGRVTAYLLIIVMLSCMIKPESFAYIERQAITQDNDFEAHMNRQGFPESYKGALRQLHTAYPNWVFEAQKAGMDWNDAVKNQYILGKNLVASGSISSWKSIQSGAYNWDTSTWVGLDGAGWVAASEEILAFHLDPRNFLDENSVFLFLKHSYNPSLQNTEGLKKIVQNTFMAGSFSEGGSVAYTDLLMDAASKSAVNPYVLASMIIQEQGVNGIGKSISGNEPGYGGLYNFFNIEAYAANSMTAVQRGLWYASLEGNYGRPWNSRSASLIGGSTYYGNNYVSVGQDTFYLKKFNVLPTNPHKHQYMTNVQGAASEAAKLAQAYGSEFKNMTLEFKIPVFDGMPESKAPMPTGNGSPNNLLKELSINNYSLTPGFDKYVTEYNLIVPGSADSVSIHASALNGNSAISGNGNVSIHGGTNSIVISVKAQNGNTKNYTIHVAREGTVPPVTAGAKGDVNGDGIINALDLLKIQKYLLGVGTIEEKYSGAADVNGNGKIDALDLLKVQKHILGIEKLTQ